MRARDWLVAAALVSLAACGDRVVGGTDGGTVKDAGADVDPDDCDAGIHCFADFPCRSPTLCYSRTDIVQCVTLPCEVACGTRCCSGAQCGGNGAVTPCGPGIICFETHMDGGYQRGQAECKPPRDAGADASYAGWIEGTGDQYCY